MASLQENMEPFLGAFAKRNFLVRGTFCYHDSLITNTYISSSSLEKKIQMQIA